MSDKTEQDRFSSDEEAEKMRKRYKYRKLIQSGKLVLPYKDAAALLGPDTAYHLYGVNAYTTGQASGEKRSSARNKRNKN